MSEIYRHGDILISPIKELPKGLKKKKDTILAYGEATNHNHALKLSKKEFADQLEVYLDQLTQKVYFKTNIEVDLEHQEHKTITIAPGTYQVDIEREYDPFLKEINQVID